MIPQQTTYPDAANYAAVVKAANQAAAAAAADYGYSYSYSYIPANPTAGFGAGGRVGSPAGLPYGKAGTNKNVGASPNNVSPNNAAISAPPEELLGPFSGIVSAVESSVESSLLGKVTSLPASEASKFKSSVQSRESSILGIASLTSSTSASTSTSATPRASESAGKTGDVKEAKEKKGSEEAGKGEDKDSGAGALLWEGGSAVAAILFVLGIWFA